MRNKVAALAACALMMGAGLLWAEDAKKDEVTLKGTLECAKCALHETDKCQNVLVVKDGDKVTKYYFIDNTVAKTAHKGICTAPKENVTVTGVVTEKDGKEMIEATKVE